jgi:hypothetical protein
MIVEIGTRRSRGQFFERNHRAISPVRRTPVQASPTSAGRETSSRR